MNTNFSTIDGDNLFITRNIDSLNTLRNFGSLHRHDFYEEELYINISENTEFPLFLTKFYYSKEKYIRLPVPREPRYKSLGAPFIDAFRSSTRIFKVDINGVFYYVAKGSIFLEDFTPLICYMYSLDNIDINREPRFGNNNNNNDPYRYHLDPSRIHIYINRLIYNPTFISEHKKLSNVIQKKILTEVMKEPYKISIRDRISIFSEFTNLDASNLSKYKELDIKIIIDEIIENIDNYENNNLDEIMELYGQQEDS